MKFMFGLILGISMLFVGCTQQSVPVTPVVVPVVDINTPPVDPTPTPSPINLDLKDKIYIGLGGLIILITLGIPAGKWLVANVPKLIPVAKPVPTPAPGYYDYSDAWLLLRNQTDIGTDKDAVTAMNYVLVKLINGQVVQK